MSATSTGPAAKAGTLQETERIQAGPGPGRGPFGGGMVGQKAMEFGPSAKRMLRRMRPERTRALLVVAFAIASVTLTAVGPRILGRATDLIFAGLFGQTIPPGVTQAQAVAGLRERGDGRVADMLAAMDHVVPGQGVDFTAVADVLLLVLGVYVVASLLAWVQGYLLNDVVQRTVWRMRAEVEDKVNKLPLGYFDRQPRGELLVSGHQRHRQRLADPAADHEPAHDLAAHGGRGALDDVLDLADPGPGGPGLGADLDGCGRRHHEALAGPVRRPVAAHRARSTATSRRRSPVTPW